MSYAVLSWCYAGRRRPDWDSFDVTGNRLREADIQGIGQWPQRWLCVILPFSVFLYTLAPSHVVSILRSSSYQTLRISVKHRALADSPFVIQHHLLEHFEECHVNVANGQVVIGSDSANIAVAAAAAAAQQQGQLTGVQTSPVNGKLSVNNLKNAKAALKQQQQAQQSPKSASGTSQRQSSRLQQSTSINGSASNQKRSRKQSLRAGSSALASTADDDTLADDRDGDFDSDNGEDMLDGDMPQFDDFEQEEKERQAALSGATADAMASTSSSNAASPSAIPPAMSALAGQSSNPTLSAPPSPALSSYSDHPSLFRQRNKTASSASLVNMTVRKATSRSPPSPNSLNADSPVSAFDDVGGQLHFARRTRQQSVDSVASVSTNASTSSKKRSFGAAMGPGTSNNLNASSARGRPSSVVGLGSQMPGIDLTHMRNPSIISTPDSSRPGSPASEFDALTYSLLSGPNGGNGNVNTNVLPTMSTLSLLNANTASTALPPNQGTSAAAMSGISAATPAANLLGAGEGCLPPSLLFPAVRGNSQYAQDDDTDSMHTDEDHDDLDNESQGDYSEQGDASYDDGMLGDEDMAYMRNSAAFPNAQMAMGSMHASKRKRMSSTPQQQNGFMTRQKRNGYDSNADSAAAAMFSPLTLLGVNGSGEGHRNGYNPAAKASAATLAAIQAAAAANAFPSGSTPTGRVWIPNNAKPFKCPVPGCDKAYKQQNGLKYHRLHGHCSAGNNSSQGEAVEEKDDGSDDKPFGCYVGPACGKKYKK